MRPVLFKIGKLSIPGYGLMIALGFVIALLVGGYRAKKKGLDAEAVIDLAIIAILTGFLGAKLLYIIISFREFLESPAVFLKTSGFVVYGGIISGVLCCMLYCRIKKLKFLDYFDLVMPEVAIAQGFGRIGCFLAGCCYGRETDAAWGITFPADSMAPSGVKLIPTQLMSAVGDFVIAAVLIVVADVLVKKIKLVSGDIGCLYVWMYGIGRFFIEFLRNDFRGSVGPFSTSQFISLFAVAGGVVLCYVNRRLKKDRTKESTQESL